MSQQPPPPPYDGPPAPAVPPNPYGPGTYPAVPAQPRTGMSVKAKFWVGFALALPANFIAAVLVGAAGAAGTAVGGDDPEVGGVFSAILGLALLGVLVVGIVVEKTRWLAIGLLVGTVVMGILAVGAIVLLLVALTQSYG